MLLFADELQIGPYLSGNAISMSRFGKIHCFGEIAKFFGKIFMVYLQCTTARELLEFTFNPADDFFQSPDIHGDGCKVKKKSFLDEHDHGLEIVETSFGIILILGARQLTGYESSYPLNGKLLSL